MVPKARGPCTFCGKSVDEVSGLAGRAGGVIVICNECIDLVMDLIAIAKGEREPDENMEEMTGPPVCSFCDANEQEVAHLVRGPGVSVCDACAAEAATFLETAVY
jgi:ATP-dependent protease Clp ATPase subunit